MGYEVMKEAEEFYFPGNEIGVLVIHGFTGSTQSMRFLGERLAETGFTVFGPRLTGHGTDPEDMEASSYEDWMNDVQKGLEKLKQTCQSIFVCGLSMGGTLTLYLAENDQEIKGIMPINAAINLPEFIRNYELLSESNTRFVEGIGSDIKQEGVTELAYSKTPVKSMGDIIPLTKEVKDKLGQITAPALIFKSQEDHVVPPENSDIIYESISSQDKTLVELKESYHVATLDNDKEEIAQKCIAFIKERI